MRWFGWFRSKQAQDAGMSSATAMIAGRVRTRGLPYMMPHDVEELNRLDFQHYMLRATLRGNYLAPIGTPASILDVGTGTGRWARELAAIFPNASVIGLDVNAPPEEETPEAGKRDDLRPPNYRFVPGNVLEGLPFAASSFDFVHQRALLAAVPHDRWPFVTRELARVARPGGWVESLEVTELEQGGPAVEQLVNWLRSVMARRGVAFADGGKVGEYLREAGLVNARTQVMRMPCGDAGGRIGKMLAADWFSLFKATSGFMVSLGLTTAEQLEQVFAAAHAELAAPKGRCAMPVYIAYGQRN